MTGNWGGYRQRLIDWGLTPTITYDTTILGNPVGGERKGLKYVGLLNLYLDFDLEKLLSINGTRLVASVSWASGQSLSADDIGNVFAVSNIFSGNSVRLYQLFLESDLWNDMVTVALGRMAIGDYFATTGVFNYYVSDAFNPNPGGIVINIPAYTADPAASWGARMTLRPVDDFYIAVGAFNSNPLLARDGANGVDFSFRDGVILTSEAGYIPNRQKGTTGLPGKYKIGAYYDTGKFEEFGEEEGSRNGNYGFYVIADQMVYREAASGSQGLTIWGSVALAPEEEINTFPLFLSAGFEYEGLVPSRDGDKALLGMAYGSFSDKLKGQDYEIVLEGTYLIQIAPWICIQPDVQYIIHPDGGGIPNALVLGMLLSLDI